MKRLSDYLKEIGHETHDAGYVDATGTIRPITKDEAVAREVWRRALGYEEEVTNLDGSVSHRTFPPDPKMQQFIFERLEGKNVTPIEERLSKLLDKVSEVEKNRMNDVAEQLVKNDKDD